MNTAHAAELPLYAVLDRRSSTGRPRIVWEGADPQAAKAACDLLKWSGASVEIVLLTAIEGETRDDTPK